MLGRIIKLAGFLREGGANVSTPEIMDAAAALALAPAYDLETVRTLIRACMVKDKNLNLLFDRAFELSFSPGFPPAGGAAEAEGGGGAIGRGRGSVGSGPGDAGEGESEGGSRSAGKMRVVDTEDLSAGQSGLINLPFLSACQDEKRRMLAVIRELAKKLAVKKGRVYRTGGSKADFRRLWRKSLASGGVPIELAWKERRRNKPQVFIICDLSNSMYAYLSFFLEFIFNFAAVRGTVRIFGFVDTVEDITALIDPSDMQKSVDLLSSRARVARRGLTDYGSALKYFYKLHREELTKRTFLVIIGDARNN
jgi:uncharacterized protein with von Willebrand factor type A (vWA) domain